MPPPLIKRWRLKRPPLTVVAYVAIVVALIVTLFPSETHPGAPLAVVIVLGASAGLIFGFWLAWLFLVVVESGNLILAVLEQPSSVVLGKAVMVALLLSRSTRRHLSWPRRRRIAASG